MSSEITNAAEGSNPETTDQNAGEEQVTQAPRRRRATTSTVTAEEQTQATEQASGAETKDAGEPQQAAEAEEKPKRRRRTKAEIEADKAAAEAAKAEAASEGGNAEAEEKPKRRRRTKAEIEADKAAAEAAKADTAESEGSAEADTADKPETADEQDSNAGQSEGRSRRRRGRGGSGNNGNNNGGNNGNNGDQQDKGQQEKSQQDKGQQGGQDRDAKSEDGQRSGRRRERGRRGGDADPEIYEDDVLLPIAGILEVLDNYAFVRTSGYLPGPNDVYVSLGQVKKYHLRKGDAVIGAIKQPREGEQHNSRQKYNALAKVETVNGRNPDELEQRVEFADQTPIYPRQQLSLAGEPVAGRAIDLLAPVGLGTRGIIAAPPRTGKTQLLTELAQAVIANRPEAHLMLLTVDERPEEVTEYQRAVQGEVIASTFDRPAEDHTALAELAVERAKRLAEMGHDVVLIVDGLTRLTRAYGLSVAASGRSLTGLLDANALQPVKQFFGAARTLEEGGSVTILATLDTETGSDIDDAIYEELADFANMQLTLSGAAADRRVFPAIDVAATGTKRADLLVGAERNAEIESLRGKLTEGADGAEPTERLVAALANGASAADVLASQTR